MTIRQLLTESVFQPEDAARMVAAFERALDQLRLKDRDDPVTTLIAKTIIEMSAGCDGGAEELCETTLKKLGISASE